MKKQIVAIILAVVLSTGCIPCSWAADAKSQADPGGGAIAAAVVSDIVWIPGKAGICATSGILWTVSMILTAGQVYGPAGNMVHSACTGKWVLTGQDFVSPPKDI